MASSKELLNFIPEQCGGQYAKSTPDVFVATGFNKWGMTNAMVAADVLCDLVKGKSNPYTVVFDPSRTVFHPQLGNQLADNITYIPFG